ncbi:hypothetical protein [Desulforamulus hydrothermalis]|uniref:Uncharacterized protein n=1 Tax=Desulforamulus hydrothermalis Lam5 = DSM 18033 TaxID=1121428 RepID=K8E818_9FIRM|nr:hypothetical protein [Desulforamulus hydrothermalis]CCO07648.1 conserved hypothetical protein [Desulforamulus hydrothermalis Lam5 = DSM 18033]SHH24494.1 hypothetical protein SAMN02745177_01938 [Desulforamulus hydrothermalis Lam5 = DSM 18033]
MSHLTKDDLVNLLNRLRQDMQNENQIQPASITEEEKELLKMYIPMQLSEESAKQMMEMLHEIQTGKRPPLSEQERIKLNQKNMDESLINFLNKLATADQDELAAIYEICERIRSNR